MVLPASGEIKMSQIRTELGIPSQAPFSLDTAENGGYVAINQNSPSKPSSGNPASMSEWYSYNHTYTTTTTTTTVACYSYAVENVTFSGGLSACATGFYTLTKYSNCSSLSSGCTMYSNSSCTNIDYQPATYVYQTSDSLNFEITFMGTVGSTAGTPC